MAGVRCLIRGQLGGSTDGLAVGNANDDHLDDLFLYASSTLYQPHSWEAHIYTSDLARRR